MVIALPCDYSLYPKDWKQIREKILKRARHQCERCRLPQYAVYRWNEAGHWVCIGGNIYLDDLQYTGSHAEAVEVRDSANEDEPYDWRVCVLTISHQDHDVQNNAESNLKALCPRCHLLHDGKLHAAHSRQTRQAKAAKVQPVLIEVEA